MEKTKLTAEQIKALKASKDKQVKEQQLIKK